MLWDLIRDFFVEHVFGGYTSQGVFYGSSIGNIWRAIGTEDEEFYNGNLTDLLYKVDDIGTYTSASDWLSTTATAIAITIIVVLCCMFIYKMVKLIGGLIR